MFQRLGPGTFLFLFCAASASAQDLTLEGLQNGDFGGVTQSGVQGLRGLFWAGAEDSTVPGAGAQGWHLDLAPGQGAFQAVGVSPDRFATARIAGKVSLRAGLSSSAHVTISEAPELVTQLRWGTSITDPAIANPWSFHQLVNGVPQQLEFNNAQWELPTLLPKGSPSSFLSFGKGGVTTARIQEALLVRYDLPNSGMVRVLHRPMHRTGDGDVDFEVRHVTAAGPTVLETFTRTPLDTDTNHRTLRFPVVNGDCIEVVATRVGGSLTPTIYWPLEIKLEGRKLTYVLSDNPSVPASTNRHVFVHDPQPANSSWQSFGPFDAGADFAAAFATAPPRPPIEIELGNPSGSMGAVKLDDLSCTVDLPDVTEDELRNKVIAEFDWVRKQHMVSLDRGSERLGALESPFAVGLHKTRGGIEYDLRKGDPGGCYMPDRRVGRIPSFLKKFLAVGFHQGAYEDWSWIQETQLHLPRTSPAGHMFAVYDLEQDEYLPLCAADRWPNGSSPRRVTPAVEISLLLDEYDRTNDPDYVHACEAYVQTMETYGVITPATMGNNPEPLDGLIFPGGYRITDGVLVNVPALYDNMLTGMVGWGAPASAIIRFCIAAREVNDAAPGPVQRFTVADLNRWFELATTAAQSMAAHYTGQGTWGADDWQQYHGEFNDTFGYLSLSVTEAYERLEPFLNLPANGYTWNVPATMTALRDGVARNGADHFLQRWAQATERSGFLAADQARAYPAYLGLVNSPAAVPNRAAYARQMLNVSKAIFRHMHSAGVWVNFSCDWFQVADESRNGTGVGAGPPDKFIEGIGRVLRMDSPYLDPADRPELVVRLNAMFDRSKELFRGPHGYYDLNALMESPPTNTPHRLELRSMEAFGSAVAAFEYPLPPPTASISPASYLAPPTVGPFSFTIEHAEAQGVPVEVARALYDRTVIYLRRETVTGDWDSVQVWPGCPTCPPPLSPQWATPVWDYPNGRVTLTLTNAAQFLPTANYKFVVVTRDGANQRWTQATSRQE